MNFLAHQDPGLAIALVAAALLLVAVLVVLVVRRRRAKGGGEPAPATWTSGLAKTRGGLTRRLVESWRGATEVDAWLAEVEEILLASDVGVMATGALLDRLRGQAAKAAGPDEMRDLMRVAVLELLGEPDSPECDAEADARPCVMVVVGVNGVGKTTTIGKLARLYGEQGKKVLLVAADTFRAAATEQLAAWAERVGADLVKHRHGADPSAVAFDGVKAAAARGADVVIIDTAGRLHVKVNLMEELKKIVRTVGRQIDGAPHETLLVIDATTGQNALVQARVFHEAIRLTGVVISKLDGTARGGVILAIRTELGVPIRYVGLGEGSADLAPFDAEAFVDALFEAPAGSRSA